jgi:primosomal replication protein N
LNKLVLSGIVVGLEPIRYTPAGLPLLSLVLQHASEQIEAGLKRKVECEVNAVVLGDLASELAKQQISLGMAINVQGFLAKRSAKSTQLILHVTHLKLIDSNI